MNAVTIYRVLGRVQTRLNLILISTHAFKVMKLTVGAAALLVMVAHLSGWAGANLVCWLLLTLCGVIAGMIYGWYQRLKPATVVHWIDEQLHSHEALTAALICLDRGCNNAWDQAIVERALLLTSDDLVFKWPLQNLRRQALICGAIYLSITILLYFGLQINPMIRETTFSNLIQPKKTSTGRMNRNGYKTVPQTPREIAQALFPQNSKLARLAESALNRGDLDAIKSLMKKSAMVFEEKAMQNAAIPQEQRQRQARESAYARAQLMQALSNYGQNQYIGHNSETRNENVTGNSAWQENNDKTSRSKEQYQKNVQTANTVTNSDQAQIKAKTNGRDAQNPQFKGDSNNQKPGQGTLSGRGSNNDKHNWGEIKAKSNPPNAIIAKRKDSPVLEFILPGKNLRIPVAQILPAMRREAEAALNRQGVPGEYEEYLRIYFVELSQKLKGQAPVNGGQK